MAHLIRLMLSGDTWMRSAAAQRLLRCRTRLKSTTLWRGNFTRVWSAIHPACLGTPRRHGSRKGAAVHNCREAVLGLLALKNWRKDARADGALRRLCRSILDAVGAGSRFGGECLTDDGWTSAFSGILASAPATTGRLIRPLVQYYRQSGDEVALELARRFADDNLATAFEANGTISAAAGSHIHSITGTIMRPYRMRHSAWR